MGSLIERPLVHRDFQVKYPQLLAMYDRDLDQAKLIYNQQLALNRSQQVSAHSKTFVLLDLVLYTGPVH